LCLGFALIIKPHNSSYTQAVQSLVDAIHSDGNLDSSLYEQAAEYFETCDANKQKLDKLSSKLLELRQQHENLAKNQLKSSEQQILHLKKQWKKEYALQENQRLVRLNNALDQCQQILSLSEAEDHFETQLLSAKFLTTLTLLSPGKGKKLAELHQRLKPVYKAVLSMRVLDKLVTDGVVKNTHIMQYYNAQIRYQPLNIDNVDYQQSVVVPILFAALFQDVGLQHPKLNQFLSGNKNDKDRFRLLEKDERDEMLGLVYRFTLDYLTNGLGCQADIQGTEEEVSFFAQVQKKRLTFQLGLIQDANSSKRGTSEIIKVPQIYASVIFSTKREFVRKTLPTASLLIQQLAVKKAISQQIANAFIDIVGHFPLGYGVVYIPHDLRGNELGHYEYGIVTELNPENLNEPMCRFVTKNMIFVPHGISIRLPKERNLHFAIARKKLVKINAKRLAEIMKNLTHNYKIKQNQELVPYYWEPHEYFFVDGNQNLWSASDY
jgi:hypothetical protein